LNRTYPIFLDLAGRRCLVVGGGRVAERKVRALLKSRAAVTVLSPVLSAGLLKLSGTGKISHRSRGYRQGDLKGFYLVIAATDNERANRRIAGEAESNDIPGRPRAMTY
jgi:precorrin-2 dehydrogenase/sirohydrochlorin ferrochelatase